MEFTRLSVLALICLVLVGSDASKSGEDYWNSVWPNTHLPKTLSDLLMPYSEIPIKAKEENQYWTVFFEHDLYPGKQMSLGVHKHSDIHHQHLQPKITEGQQPFGARTWGTGEKVAQPFGDGTWEARTEVSQPFGARTWGTGEKVSQPLGPRTLEARIEVSQPFGARTWGTGEKVAQPFGARTWGTSEKVAQPFGARTWGTGEKVSQPFGARTWGTGEKVSQPFGARTWGTGEKVSQPFGARTWGTGEKVSQPLGARTWEADKEVSQPFGARTWGSGKKVVQPFGARTWGTGEKVSQPFGARTWGTGEKVAQPFGARTWGTGEKVSQPFGARTRGTGEKVSQPLRARTWETLEQLNQPFGARTWGSEKESINDYCGKPSSIGEEKYCALSLKSMMDFAISKLGTNIKVISSSFAENHDQYVVEEVKKIGDKAVMCHRLNFEKVVFYCHQVNATTAYMVPLVASDGIKAEALTICHHDTRGMNPDVLYDVLKVKPGTIPVCHFVGNKAVAWVPNRDASNESNDHPYVI